MSITFNPLLLISSVALGAVSAYLGYKREKNPYLWFAIGFFFGLFGVLTIFLTGQKKNLPDEEKKLEPVLTLSGPIDKFWYYLDSNQKQQGPMSQNAIINAWKEGKIDLSTYVWHEEMTDWKPLGDCQTIK